MNAIENRIEELLGRMTLREKIGQMTQTAGRADKYKERVKAGEVGSFLNITDIAEVQELQRISVRESPLGIPLLFGRDVIHGYQTTFPIPLAQAASWNLELVEEAARIAAKEASAAGIRWAFSPMVDVSRDPRWGRVAEGAGEDPWLAGKIGSAMVRGYQGKDLSSPESLAACAKHFVAYGLSEAGREYNSTEVSERTLREIYLRPFKACVDAGVATLMSGFNDISGIPASGNSFTLRQVLREEWDFKGVVVSDWESIKEMISHGFCADGREAAREGTLAGVDMEMTSTFYLECLEKLVEAGDVPQPIVDDAVRNILRLKFRLGLFENALGELPKIPAKPKKDHEEVARRLARESCVLLKNEADLLPLNKGIASLALIGPMADSPFDQLGCWTMDGKPADAVTPLTGIRGALPSSVQVNFVRALKDCNDNSQDGFAEAVRAAEQSEAVVLFLGEGANLSGEARSRAFLDLPGAQLELLKKVRAVGKPVTVVLMTGRPMTLAAMFEQASSVLLAWHPGAMGGPAIADLLFGDHAPSGKLTMSFPRCVGQIPVYYNHRNTGRPAMPSSRNLPLGTPDNPVGFLSQYLDVDNTPEFPFGFGLSYSSVAYGPAQFQTEGETFHIKAEVSNTGPRAICEVVQLYVRDVAGNVTRPMKELKGFQRVDLEVGARKTVSFTLTREDLAFYGRDCQLRTEAGEFHVWIAGSSELGEPVRFFLE